MSFPAVAAAPIAPEDLGDAVGIPWLVPAMALVVVASVVLAQPLGRRLSTSPMIGWLVIMSIGLIVAATLTPLEVAGDDRSCDLSRFGLAPFRDVRRITDASLNIALFVPLGVALVLLPAGRFRTSAIGAAIALPLAIETVQWLAPVLGRGCQSADVVDNLSGLALGALVGIGLRRLAEH